MVTHDPNLTVHYDPEVLRHELLDAEQDATKQLTCKRKAVCTSLATLNAQGFNTFIRFFNGPIGEDQKRCTNVVGGCGCIHSEFRAMRDLLGLQWLQAGGKVDVCVTYSPCTPCANLIYLCRKYIQSVHWLYDTEHDMRGIEILEQAGFEHLGKL